MNRLLQFTGSLLTLACISSLAENPQLKARWPQAQDAPISNAKICRGDGVVHMADAAFGFRVWNVANPVSPWVIAGFRAEWQPQAIAQSGSVAAVADADGATIYLVDSGAMRVASAHHEPDGVTAIAMGSGALAVGNQFGEVTLIDVRAPYAPEARAVFESIGAVTGVDVSGQTAFIACASVGIDVVDISNLDSPARIATYFRPQLKGTAVSGIFLYAHLAPSSDDDPVALGIERWDVANPWEPRFAGAFYPWDARRIERFSASESFALVSWVGETEYQRFHTVADFRAEGLATVAGSFHMGGLIDEGTIYAVSENVFGVGQLTEPGAFEFVGSAHAQTRARGVAFAGERAFTIESGGMARVVDCQSASLDTVAQTGLGEEALAVVTDGTLAYVRSENGDIVVLDGEGRYLSSFALPPGRLLVAENRAYLLREDTAQLEVYDLSDLWFPALLGSCPLRTSPTDAVLRNSLVFVAEGSGGIEIVDAREPFAPRVIAHLPIPNASACALSGNALYVAEQGAGVRAIDVSNVTEPVPGGHAAMFEPVLRLIVNGTILYARSDGGVTCFEVSEPLRPVMLARGETPIRELATGGGAVWAVRQDGALATVDLQPVMAAPTMRDGKVELLWHGPGMRLQFREDWMTDWIDVARCAQTNRVRLGADSPMRIFRLAP